MMNLQKMVVCKSTFKSGCLSLADSQLRCVHLSAADHVGRYPFFNKHKKVTDPARLEENYFENMASRVPLDERYLENLRLIWDEKIGSQRELRLKTQDSLIGRKKSLQDYGLPQVDMNQPKVAYRYVEALRTAPPSVRKIFSVRFGQRSDMTGARKVELSEKIIGHKYDQDSHAAQVALATVSIRHWTYRMDEVQARFPNRERPKWLANRIAAMLVYRQAHLRWLSINDSETFDRVVKELKIAYHVPMQGFDTQRLETRKTWTEKMLRARNLKEKENRLHALHEKFKEGREEKVEQINLKMQQLDEEKKNILERLKQIDLVEGRLSEACVGKYQQKLVEEFSEISLHSIFFNHPKMNTAR